MGVPALAYTVQGNLLFVALAHLEAPTYQVLAQGKTLARPCEANPYPLPPTRCSPRARP